MIKHGFHPDLRTCTTLSNAGASVTERERSWAFESIILAYAKEGKLQQVQDWLSKMLNDGLVPTDTVRHGLLHLCHSREGAAANEIKEKLGAMRKETKATHSVDMDRHGLAQDGFNSRNKGRRNNGKGGKGKSSGLYSPGFQANSPQKHRNKEQMLSPQTYSFADMLPLAASGRYLQQSPDELNHDGYATLLTSSRQLPTSAQKTPQLNSNAVFGKDKDFQMREGYHGDDGVHFPSTPQNTFNVIPKPSQCFLQSPGDYDPPAEMIANLQDLLATLNLRR
jgi:hypothetical protein